MPMDDAFDNVDYTPYISAPLSTSRYARFYREHIEPHLISILESLDIEYFFTLTLLNVQTDSEKLVAPLVVIYTTSEGVPIVKTSLDIIWDINDFSEYLVFITKGSYVNTGNEDNSFKYQSLPFQLDQYRTIHETWKCGMSIGYHTKTATSGAILENSINKYAAITCAHLFHTSKSNYKGLKVTQPSYEDFCYIYSEAQSNKRECEEILTRSLTETQKLKYEAQLVQINEFLVQLGRYRHDTSEVYQQDAEHAMVIKAGFEVVDYLGRRCLKDYALLDLLGRIPEEHNPRDKKPENGFLRTIDWATDASSVGELQWDIRVKKRGRSSGVTYGIIAGVHGVMSTSNGGPRREYWSLPEALCTSLYEFGREGDSGSLVWTNDGTAVGIIIAGWTCMFEQPPVMAAILPNRYWDTKNIPFSRREDGTIDFAGLMSFAVDRPLCLVESLKMVLDDIGNDRNLWVPFS